MCIWYETGMSQVENSYDWQSTEGRKKWTSILNRVKVEVNAAIIVLCLDF